MKVAYCLFKDQFQHIKPVEKAAKGLIKFVYDSDWKANKIKELRPDIILGINEYHYAIAECYHAASELNIPTLTLQDGVLEWRYLFDNPMFNGNKFGVPLHLPIIADKYACIGSWWLGLIAAMGNEDKVELTGMPKMDSICDRNLVQDYNTSSSKKILIMTAAKPWFEAAQKHIMLKMLHDLKSYFKQRPDIEVIWRVTKDIDKELNIVGVFHQKESQELVAQLADCDAVISTTSTAMLETLLMGKPLARLDYFNTPTLFPSVWSITHHDQINNTINSLLHPKSEQLFWQEVIKKQVISHLGVAANRVVELMHRMIDYRIEHPYAKLPPYMLESTVYNGDATQSAIRFLYPQRESLVNTDVHWLRAKLARLERENELLKMEVARKSIGGLLLSLYNKLNQRL